MSPSRPPLPEQASPSKVAEDFGNQMARHCFAGDIDHFHAVFAEYLSIQPGSDPFGRLLLRKLINRGGGLLAFHSITTDPLELQEQSAIRWKAWLSVLPLDMQMSLLVMEFSPRTGLPVDLDQFKWDQRRRIVASADPDAAYAASGLFSVSPSASGRAPAAGSWLIMEEHLVSLAQNHAMQLMAAKSWQPLEAWMAAADLHASDAVAYVHIHFTEKYVRGSALAKADPPLPLWTMGLFTGATEPEFWRVMQKFGGPAGAHAVFQEMGPGNSPSPAGVSISGRRRANPPPPDQWGDPLAWVKPQTVLTPSSTDPVARTHASWMQEALRSGVPIPQEARKPAARF